MTSRQYNGQEGIELALKILQHEFKLTMGLAGCVAFPHDKYSQADCLIGVDLSRRFLEATSLS